MALRQHVKTPEIYVLIFAGNLFYTLIGIQKDNICMINNFHTSNQYFELLPEKVKRLSAM